MGYEITEGHIQTIKDGLDEMRANILADPPHPEDAKGQLVARAIDAVGVVLIALAQDLRARQQPVAGVMGQGPTHG